MMMNCDQAQLLLSDYVVGRMRPESEVQMRSHLTSCPACAAELELSQRAMQMVESLISQQPPSEMWSRVAQQVGVKMRRRAALANWRAWCTAPRRWSWALAAVLVIGGAMSIRQKLNTPPAPPVLPRVASTFLQQHSFTNAFEPFSNSAAWGTLTVAAYRGEVTR